MIISFADIKKNRLYPITALDQIVSHRNRHRAYRLINLAIICVAIGIAALWLAPNIAGGAVSRSLVNVLAPKFFGLALVLFSASFTAYCLETFFRSLYFKEHQIASRAAAAGDDANSLSFDVVAILARVNGGDVTEAFFNSAVGKSILIRAGISSAEQGAFLKNRVAPAFLATKISVEDHKEFTLPSFVAFLLSSDKDFVQFLAERGIREKDVIGAAEWVTEEQEEAKRREQWWSSERLTEIPAIGKDWAYAQAFSLRRFGREVDEEYSAGARIYSVKDNASMKALESILARSSGANAIVVAPSEDAAADVIYFLARHIRDGATVPEIAHKKIYMFGGDALIALSHNKQEFEREFLLLLSGAEKAGNIILVIPAFTALMKSANVIGANLLGLMTPYLSSSRLHIIGLASSDAYNESLQANEIVSSQFETVRVAEPSDDETMALLKVAARKLELENGVIFTYAAIAETARAAENYITEGVMPDRALGLLIEIAPSLRAAGKEMIMPDDVLSFVRAKTDIPVGKITEDERNKLVNLEVFLHKRVVGQDEAVAAVASAMRRARAGVRNLKRPIGSFLFLGPTGVGKTETAKALAEAFFGDEKVMMRLDMSEYQSADALSKLTGSFISGKAGVLSAILREKPYGVLLLDEFEKTNKDVMNLFLQILDDGFFSDMHGKRVNARNIIFIATSNAGSELIWNTVKAGGNSKDLRRTIVGDIIDAHIFSPELVNRFDAVILFNPLSENDLRKIARLMLVRLASRLAEKSITLDITDELVDALLRFGNDPAFGARPMIRAIQEKVEQKIAEKIIRGEIFAGSRIALSAADIA